MDQKTRESVRNRAGDRCEYCQLPQQFSPVARLQKEHIIPLKHGGDDALENLALACIDCNLAKSSNLSGIDDETGQIVELFNPRTQKWDGHFRRDGALIVGTTAVGRATVRVLNMNTAHNPPVIGVIHPILSTSVSRCRQNSAYPSPRRRRSRLAQHDLQHHVRSRKPLPR